MQLVHSFNNKSVKKEGEASFLLTDKRGGYFSLANKRINSSHYQGWFSFLPEKWIPYKIIENIRLDKEPDHVENQFYRIVRKTGEAKENIYLTQEALMYEVEDYEGYVHIDLDFREIHDFSDKGRIYSIREHNDELIVTYKKYNNDQRSRLLRKYYLVIKGVDSWSKTDKWVRKRYPYDKERGTVDEFYIYEALKIKVSGQKALVFTLSQDKEEAQGTASYVYSHMTLVKGALKKYFDGTILGKDFAYDCAKKSLDDLTVTLPVDKKEMTGIFAGLPWFYQFWARDENISLIAPLLQGDYKFVKEVLLRHLDQIRPDGMLPNRFPASELGNADGAGWACKRLHQLLKILKAKGKLSQFYSKKELDTIRKQVMVLIDKLRTAYEKDGMIYNRAKETWMDTDFGGDLRDGARIEIQAMQLAIYQLAQFLCNLTNKKYSKQYAVLEKEMKQKVRQSLFKDDMLADGYNDNNPDFTIRPNIFLAHYAYPNLLSKKEWKAVFKKALSALWCDWGGLSSIDKSHPWYKPKHTGFNNESYHRGDSWYFVNNMAAISMYKVDKDFFKSYIKKILEASKEETLFKGYMGHCAELSNAFDLSSKGCWAQAWSAATLIEALKLIEKA